MTHPDDAGLVERLRGGVTPHDGVDVSADTIPQAADRIEALKGEVAEAIGVIRQIVTAWKNGEGWITKLADGASDAEDFLAARSLSRPVEEE